MSINERNECIKNSRACILCLKIEHIVKNCRSFMKYMICIKRCSVFLCDMKEDKNALDKRVDATANNTINISNVRSITAANCCIYYYQY